MARIIANCKKAAFPSGAPQLLENLLSCEPLQAQRTGLRVSAVFSTPEIASLNEVVGGQKRVGVVQCSWESPGELLTFTVQDVEGGRDNRLTQAFQNFLQARPGIFTLQSLVDKVV